MKMANEVRLIDANALWRKFESEHWYDNADRDEIALPLVDDVPTVDAVEVVHGQWEDMWGGKYANPRYRCSVCKEKALYKFERDLLDNWKEVQALTPNCPYCMAKLDGGTDNDI